MRNKTRQWSAKARILVVGVAALIGFLSANLIPLYRSEIEPRFLQDEIIESVIRIVGDTPNYYVRNKNDGTVYAVDYVDLVLRITNKSQYPVTVDRIIMKPSWNEYSDNTKSNWEYERVYTGGAEILYESFGVEFSPSSIIPVNILHKAAFSGNENAKFRTLVYHIPPYETEYIFFLVSPDKIPEFAIGGFNFDFEVGFVVKGQEGINSINSPVGVALGVLEEEIRQHDNSTESAEDILKQEWLYSGWYSQYDAGWKD